MEPNYDYIDYLVRYNVEYNTDVIFYKDAFKSSDGTIAPIVYQGEAYDLHLGSCLGEAIIENRDDGAVAKYHFNDTDKGKIAKEVFANGDDFDISVYANGIQYDNLGCPERLKRVSKANVKAVIVLPKCAKPTERVKEYMEGQTDE